MENINNQLRYTVYSSLFAAFIAAGAFIAIPIGPVPIVLQNMFVMLAAICLGPKWGTCSVIIYLLAGMIGLPVFAGGSGGLGRLLGPTGGYLVSYLPAVLLIGLLSTFLRERFTKPLQRLFADMIAMLPGAAVIYLIGVIWLKQATGMTYTKSIGLGMLPFLPGDLIKIITAAFIALKIRPYLLTENR